MDPLTSVVMAVVAWALLSIPAGFLVGRLIGHGHDRDYAHNDR